MNTLLSFLLSITLFFNWWDRCDKNTIAYVQEYDIVFICKEMTVDNLVHELWHIFYNHLSIEDKMKWDILYEYSFSQTWTLKNRWFVSIYATTNKYEDFAETFLYIFKWWKDAYKSLFVKQLILNFKY